MQYLDLAAGRVRLQLTNDADSYPLYIRSVRAVQAALNCIRKAMRNLHEASRPRVVLISDTPSLVKEIAQNVDEFAEVIWSNS